MHVNMVLALRTRFARHSTMHVNMVLALRTAESCALIRIDEEILLTELFAIVFSAWLWPNWSRLINPKREESL
jgi:hypothetical protein